MKQKQDGNSDCSLHRPAVCKQKAVQCRQIFCFHQDTALQIPHHDQRKHNFVCGESEDKGKQDNPINSKSLSKRVQKAGKDEQQAFSIDSEVCKQPDQKSGRSGNSGSTTQYKQSSVKNRANDYFAYLWAAIGWKLKRKGRGFPF